MTYKKKGVHRKRDKNNPVVKRRTVSVKKKHEDVISQAPAIDRNFSGFVGDLMDDFFQREEIDNYLVLTADTERLSGRDWVTLIGNDIDESSAVKCLISWLDGKPIHPVTIAERGSMLYKSMYDGVKDTPGEGRISDESRRMLEQFRIFYFNIKNIHLAGYDSLKFLIDTQCKSDQQFEFCKSKLNKMCKMEYLIMHAVGVFSSRLRFAVYDCWRNNLLKIRALTPEWMDNAADRVAAMNQLMPD